MAQSRCIAGTRMATPICVLVCILTVLHVSVQRTIECWRRACWPQVALWTVMQEDDVRKTYAWLERMARNPYTDDDTSPVVPGMPRKLRPPL